MPFTLKDLALHYWKFGRGLVAAVFLAWACSPQAGQLTGRVVAVIDGDTIIVLDDANQQYKVRYVGIDAPEKAQPFGQRSKQNLSELVFRKVVTIDCPKLDRYGRNLCTVFHDGRDTNLAQLEAGLAWHYKKYARDQTTEMRRTYADAENAARRAQVGLWSDVNPVPPWDWRHPASQ